MYFEVYAFAETHRVRRWRQSRSDFIVIIFLGMGEEFPGLGGITAVSWRAVEWSSALSFVLVFFLSCYWCSLPGLVEPERLVAGYRMAGGHVPTRCGPSDGHLSGVLDSPRR